MSGTKKYPTWIRFLEPIASWERKNLSCGVAFQGKRGNNTTHRSFLGIISVCSVSSTNNANFSRKRSDSKTTLNGTVVPVCLHQFQPISRRFSTHLFSTSTHWACSEPVHCCQHDRSRCQKMCMSCKTTLQLLVGQHQTLLLVNHERNSDESRFLKTTSLESTGQKKSKPFVPLKWSSQKL